MKKSCVFKMRLSKSDIDQLNQLSQVLHRSRSEAVRVAIGIACSLFVNNPPPAENLFTQTHRENIDEATKNEYSPQES